MTRASAIFQPISLMMKPTIPTRQMTSAARMGVTIFRY
jgi:hypothetical protein